MPKASRLAPSLVALLVSCSALSSTAQAGWFSSDPKPAEAPKGASKKDDMAAPQPAATLDDSIRQAQMLRLTGKYDEAIKNLSQLMLVAADDGRVISEYGKTLVSMGRAEEAQKFLARAQQLQPNDWTVYSALGVTYDQIGNQQEARANYERALALKPGEPSVLSNYALSRMLAKDPTVARQLADRAEVANAAAPDDKIKRNIAMIRSMAPATDGSATNTPAPSPMPVAAAHVAVTTAPLAAPVQPARPTPPVARPAPVSVPSSAVSHPVAPSPVAQALPQVVQAPNQQPRGMVMQPVPVDPLAGPVATHAPRSLQPKTEASNDTPVKPEASKPVVEAAKPASAAKVSLPVKAADVKPGATPAAPKVLPPAPVKTADAKAATAKPASKEAIPGLRLSANAY